MKKYLVIEAPANLTNDQFTALKNGRGEKVVNNILREWESHFGALPTACKVIEADAFPTGNVLTELPTQIAAGV